MVPSNMDSSFYRAQSPAASLRFHPAHQQHQFHGSTYQNQKPVRHTQANAHHRAYSASPPNSDGFKFRGNPEENPLNRHSQFNFSQSRKSGQQSGPHNRPFGSYLQSSDASTDSFDSFERDNLDYQPCPRHPINMYSDFNRRRSASFCGGSGSPRQDILRAQMLRNQALLYGDSEYHYPMGGGSLYGSSYGMMGGGMGMGRPRMGMGMMRNGGSAFYGGYPYGGMMGGGMMSGGIGGYGHRGFGLGGSGMMGGAYGHTGFGPVHGGYGLSMGMGYGRPYRTGGFIESRSPHLTRAKSWSAHAKLF